MTMRPWLGNARIWATVCVAALTVLTGCLGPRKFTERTSYALRPQPHVQKAAPTQLTLGVRPLEIAESIRDDIAYREPDFRLQYYESAQWAESPRDLVTRVLKDALVDSNHFADVGDARDIRPDLLLTGELRVFEEDRTPEGRLAVITLRLELRRTSDDTPVWADTLTAQVPVEGEGLGPLAVAMNKAVADVAERATAAIVQHTT